MNLPSTEPVRPPEDAHVIREEMPQGVLVIGNNSVVTAGAEQTAGGPSYKPADLFPLSRREESRADTERSPEAFVLHFWRYLRGRSNAPSAREYSLSFETADAIKRQCLIEWRGRHGR